MIYRLTERGKQLVIKAIENLNENYLCDIHKERKIRSNQQNSYYWGIVIAIFSQDSGYTAKEVHQIYSNTFLSYVKNEVTFTRSTTELSTIEFEDYLTKCRFLASEQGSYIPLPNECTEEMFKSLERYSK